MNLILIEIDETDIIDGVYENHDVTEITNDCFYQLQNLKKVVLPKVVKIGSNCFTENKSLTSIDIPLLQVTGNNCFTNNKSLTTIHFPLLQSVRNFCFSYNNSLTSIDIPLLKNTWDYCFSYNNSLTSIDIPLLKNVGDSCFSNNNSLTNLDLPSLKIAGRNSFKFNDSLKTINVLGQKLNHLSVDGLPFIIQSEKKVNDYTVYSGYNLKIIDYSIKKDECFVAGKENYFAHGSSIKKAIEDLEFKIISEKLKKEPIEKDTMFTVKYYRTLTGACDYGVKSWMESNNIPFEVILNEKTNKEETKELTPIKAIDLMPLLEQSNAYGFDKFKSLITW